jgi:hypothetical protein
MLPNFMHLKANINTYFQILSWNCAEVSAQVLSVSWYLSNEMSFPEQSLSEWCVLRLQEICFNNKINKTDCITKRLSKATIQNFLQLLIKATELNLL